MNKERRQRLQEAIGHLESASSIVEDVSMEEQLAHDNLPEQLQWTEKGEKMEEVISNLEEAVSLIDEATQIINDCEN